MGGLPILLWNAAPCADLAIYLTWLNGSRTHALKVTRADLDRFRNWLAATVDSDGKPAAKRPPALRGDDGHAEPPRRSEPSTRT